MVFNDENMLPRVPPTNSDSAPAGSGGPAQILVTSQGVGVTSTSPSSVSEMKSMVAKSSPNTPLLNALSHGGKARKAGCNTYPPRQALKSIGNTNPTAPQPLSPLKEAKELKQDVMSSPLATRLVTPTKDAPASPATPLLKDREDAREETGVTPLLNELQAGPSATKENEEKNCFRKPSTPSLSGLMNKPLAKTPGSDDFQISRRKSRGEKRSLSFDTCDNSPVTSKRRVNAGPKQPPPAASSGARTAPPVPFFAMPSRPFSQFSRPSLQRSFSETDAQKIRSSCDNMNDNQTGDMLQELALPTMKEGVKHPDLKNIDCHTLAKVINGEFHETINSFRIIDARYPYEYEGGHIVGAENYGWFDEDKFLEDFIPDKWAPLPGNKSREELQAEVKGKKRDILIFHCEFSSQRGPSLLKELRSRYVRNSGLGPFRDFNN